MVARAEIVVGAPSLLSMQRTLTAADLSAVAARAGHSDRDIASAQFIPYATPGSTTRDDSVLGYTEDGSVIVEPPEDPDDFYRLFRLCAYLQPVHDALDANVYGAGYTLEPILSDNEEEAAQAIREAILFDRSGGNFASEATVTDKEVADTHEQYKRRAVLERQFLEAYFEAAVLSMSWRKLQRYTGQDFENTGNFYWEIMRDSDGKVIRIAWVPATTVRATVEDPSLIACKKWVRMSVLRWIATTQLRRFRRYVQRNRTGTIIAWFKEFGDPRVMSRSSGRYYASLQALLDAESSDDGQLLPAPATELLHEVQPYGANPVYGKPQWSGVYLSLLGTRELEEENYRTVRDENIPSMLLLVSGGVLAPNAVERLKTSIAEQKGRKGLIIVEAVSASTGPSAASMAPKLQIERTKSEQTTDALFLKYEERGEKKSRLARRMPESAVGLEIGKNRATALGAHRFTEEQVYEPKRKDISEPINQLILPTLNILCWRYRVKRREPHDPQVLADIVRVLNESNLLDPNESREIIGQIFNRNLKSRKQLWQLLPSRFLTMLLQTKNLSLVPLLFDNASPDELKKHIEKMQEEQAEAAAAATATARGDNNARPDKSQNKRGAASDDLDDDSGDVEAED